LKADQERRGRYDDFRPERLAGPKPHLNPVLDDLKSALRTAATSTSAYTSDAAALHDEDGFSTHESDSRSQIVEFDYS
jgi:hypothetical protein